MSAHRIPDHELPDGLRHFRDAVTEEKYYSLLEVSRARIAELESVMLALSDELQGSRAKVAILEAELALASERNAELATSLARLIQAKLP